MTVNVLVADDEALIRQSLRSVLAQEGFVVTSASSGAEAWRLFQSERPDVVLLDLVLGDVDGLEVLRRIKQEGPETKVLILSAHGTIERAVRAMKLGAYEFLRKPFELEEILAAVRNAAHTSRLEGRLEYLAERRLKEETIAGFKLGYAPESWDTTLNFLKSRKYTENEIFLAGLAVKKDRGEGCL